MVLSDIVVHEVESHLKDAATKAASEMRRALKDVGHSWNVPNNIRDDAANQLFAAKTPAAVAKSRIEAFVANIDAEIVKAEDRVAVSELVKRYFERQPPFANVESAKHEFPDALALLSLEAWAAEEDTKVIVVSKDGDWLHYCEQSPRLVAIDNLGLALGAFQKQSATYMCLQLSEQVQAGDPLGMEKAVSDALAAQNWKIEFVPDADSQFHFDGEADEAELKLIQLVPVGGGQSLLEPVEFSDGNLVAKASALVLASVTGNFSFEKWDSVDHEYIGLGTGTADAETEIEVELLLTLQEDPPNRLAIAEVEVIDARHDIDFGEIEPDWMNDPD